jgi:hypothetical protein
MSLKAEIQMTQITHSEIAISFLKLVASGKVREAYGKYVSRDFRHHNPFFRGDRESLMLAMEENWTKNPDKKLEINSLSKTGTWQSHSPMCDKTREIPGQLLFIFSGSRMA